MLEGKSYLLGSFRFDYESEVPFKAATTVTTVVLEMCCAKKWTTTSF